MNVSNSNLGFTEEAFLLSSLHEVIKVWSRGSGQASFDLNISDGMAELKLGFKLAHPGDLHYHPHVLEDGHQHPYRHQPPRRRRKGQARRERDRLRAAEHHARTTQTPQDVILPFNGRVLATKPRISSSNHKSQFDSDYPL